MTQDLQPTWPAHGGIFLWDSDEWVTVLASYNRSLDWADATAGLTRRRRMAVVSSTTPWHQSARVGDLVVTEVVDSHNQPVPPGVPGEKVLSACRSAGLSH